MGALGVGGFSVNWFLLTIIALLALTALGKLISIATSDFPPRGPKSEAWDVAVNACLIAWALILLFRA